MFFKFNFNLIFDLPSEVVFFVVTVKVDVGTVDSAVDNEEIVETTVFSSVVDVTDDTTKIIQCNQFSLKSTLPSDVVFVVNSVDVFVVRVDVTIVDFRVDLAVDDSVEVSLLNDGETVVEVDETENILLKRRKISTLLRDVVFVFKVGTTSYCQFYKCHCCQSLCDYCRPKCGFSS